MSDFRAMALKLPDAVEQSHHGAPSFRVAGKIFAQLSTDGLTALLKLPLGLQDWGHAAFGDACQPEPGRYGQSGWTRVKWTMLPESDLADLIEAAWSAIALSNANRRSQD